MVGCKYACVCGGRCSDSCFVPEEYFGHAEDVMAQQMGFRNDDEYRAYKRQIEEERAYNEAMADYHYDMLETKEALFQEDAKEKYDIEMANQEAYNEIWL